MMRRLISTRLKRRAANGRVARAILCLVVASCGSSTDATASLNFSGTWRGTFSSPGPATVTWTATQTGNNVSGPVVVVVSAAPIQFTGTISGSATSGQLALAVAIPAGAIPGAPGCAISGVGTSTVATATSIVAQIAVSFSMPCVGVITTQTTGTAQLALSK